MKKTTLLPLIAATITMSCNNNETARQEEPSTKPYRLVTLDPGHFHAALVQKSMYPDVDSTVYVYAPDGPDLQMHLDRINGYNTRAENPTHWNEQVYKGHDFFEKMIAEKKGNVVVLAGNNQKKTEYILESLKNGFNVLADKPMVINSQGFEQLKQAFETAKNNKLLLYDIMTERSEITTVLQRELSMIPDVFGELQKGTLEQPAITKESVHHFYKYVSGSVLTRPAWFMDVAQQGEGIVDVMTHLVDLVQWECFPDQTIDYTKDIQVDKAKRWSTKMKLSEFREITKLDTLPSYLNKDMVHVFNPNEEPSIDIYCNGEINYTIRGVHAKTSVIWRYKAPEGGGDTHYSIMRGTKVNLVIRQSAEEKYVPTLYIEPVNIINKKDTNLAKAIEKAVNDLSVKYNGVKLSNSKNGWQVVISDKLREGHEAHFARVMERFLDYLKNGNLPSWEVPNMIAKYYTTTKGLETALKTKD